LRYKPEIPAIIHMPTGSGKSHVIAALAEHYYNDCRNVLVLAHRKELLEQTAGKINVPNLHFYSASIGEKSLTDNGVTIAGIQSIARAKELPSYGLVIVDECHLLPNNKDDSETQYWSLLRRLGNPPMVGLTATPWRTQGGKLSWGEIVYSIGYEPLMQANYLAPLSNKLLLDVTPNLEKVSIKLGDYVQSQLAAIMEDGELLLASIAAILKYSAGRKSCLIFTVSVNHAYLLLRAMLDSNLFAGHRIEMITGETPQWERDLLVEAFRAGEIRFLINCEILLVGFDAPRIDAIFCLRPTKSKVLWEQMLGRGVRMHPDKLNCLLVDMTGNLQDHGGLGTPHNEKAKREASEPFGKICPECEEYVSPPTARQCSDCGYEWPEPEPPKVKHNLTPNMEGSPVYSAAPVWYDVDDVTYKAKKSKNGNEMIVVQYHCNYGKYGTIADFLLPYHANDFVRGKVVSFFAKRGITLPATYTMDELLFSAEQLKKPARIQVDHSGEFPKVIGYVWETVKQLDDEIPLFL